MCVVCVWCVCVVCGVVCERECRGLALGNDHDDASTLEGDTVLASHLPLESLNQIK